MVIESKVQYIPFLYKNIATLTIIYNGKAWLVSGRVANPKDRLYNASAHILNAYLEYWIISLLSDYHVKKFLIALFITTIFS